MDHDFLPEKMVILSHLGFHQYKLDRNSATEYYKIMMQNGDLSYQCHLVQFEKLNFRIKNIDKKINILLGLKRKYMKAQGYNLQL